jgi:glycosyltransferase involved in cell wall biosynthesis
MSAPKVSIIIPTYNRGHLIGQTLESVRRQTFTDYELVIVDDGSTDNTAEVVHELAPDARYIRQENEGIPRVLNRCVLETRGEYVSFLGSDDALAPRAVERGAALLDAHPAVGIAYGPAWLMDEEGRLTHLLKPPFAKEAYVRSGREEIADLLMSNHIVATTVMVRRRCFEEAGLFDLRLHLYEDWNMWTRIFKRWDAGYINEPIAFYRVHKGEAGSIFRKADPRALARYRRMQLEDVLRDPEVGHLYKGLRSRAYARQWRAVAQRAFDDGYSWYGRWTALRTLLADPPGALGGNGRAAAWLLAKSFAPRALLAAGRRLKGAGAAQSPDMTRDKWPSLEAILHGAAVPEA